MRHVKKTSVLVVPSASCFLKTGKHYFRSDRNYISYLERRDLPVIAWGFGGTLFGLVLSAGRCLGFGLKNRPSLDMTGIVFIKRAAQNITWFYFLT